MTEEFPTRYDQSKEAELYSMWEKSGAFKPTGDGEPFSILMPPTNANGALHVGHGVGVAVQDLLVRYHRMKGNATAWWPGLDHAGFETQIVVEKWLEKQGKSRFQMEREEFYRELTDFTEKSKGTILNGLRRLGASADWSRLFYTLDDDVVSQVYDTFVKLHQDGLAYRDKRPVNWCTKHQTTLSDLETSDEERTEPLYYLKYGPLVVATGRPETIFADVAVAVNPNDERYQHLVGTEIEVDLGIETRKLPVVADNYVDPAFGTGAVKITPAHDANDFEVAKRHNLPLDVETIDQYGKLTDRAGKYAELKVDEARAAVAEHLQELGLIDKVKTDYQHAVKVCYKCKRTIEPRVLTQWFIAMNKEGVNSKKNLTKLALDAVHSGQTTFVTDKFRKIFEHWLRNIRDWPISRQIVWGIQLPVWYCQNSVRSEKQEVRGAAKDTSLDSSLLTSHFSPGECPPIVTSGTTPTECPTCHGANLERDPDVFDTWFSSDQLPVIVPKRDKFKGDFDRFYPTSVMETGWDIIFFWVARMIMFGTYLTDKVPFTDIYLHGLVRDKDSQKMSKSKGNVMDPLAVIDEYGADALRIALIFGTAAGNDMPMGEEKIRGMRNFSTKIWNIARFVMTNLENPSQPPVPLRGTFGSKGGVPLFQKEACLPDRQGLGEILKPLTEADRHILTELASTTDIVTRSLEDYRFHLAAEKLYDFIWGTFAATYVEAAKGQLRAGAGDTSEVNRAIDTSEVKETPSENVNLAQNTRAILLYVLKQSVTLLHPFMPFVTEAIWQNLPKTTDDSELLISQPWPSRSI